MKKIKKVYIVAISIFTVLSSLLLYFGATFKLERKLLYNENGSIDYKVYLKPNDYFDTEYLEKDKKYISSLIDYIDINYSYSFKTNYNMDYDCKYYILASSSVSDKGDEGKVIYENQKYLLENQTKEVKNKDKLDIKDNIKISYDEFNSIIKEFTSKFNLSNTENKLDLSLCISLEGKSEGFENLIVDKSTLNMTIPLTDQTIDMDIDYKEIDNSGEKIETSNGKFFNSLCFVLAAIAFLIDFIFIILAVKSYLKLRGQEPLYQRIKNKIFYKYNRDISPIKELFDISLYDVIDVNDFEDLLNIRDCLGKPILFIEPKKNKLSWFIVLDNEVLYRFILDEEKLIFK